MKLPGKLTVAITVVAVSAGVLVLGGLRQAIPAGCGGVIDVAAATASADSIAGYSGDQLGNAASIMNAGTTLGIGQDGQIVGVMTAMGESALRVLDHGDATGPDSRGLFQQRDNWGPLTTRMDPTGSATLFFQHLLAVPGWQQMTPTAAAHTVQRNADPDHYTRWFASATEVVQGLQLRGAGGCGSRASGDDYPWPGGVAQGLGFSVLGYTFQNCTDFVAWRLNRDVGITAAPWRYTWSNLTPKGGNAIDWKKNWEAHGWTVSSTPMVGAVAWWGRDAGRAGHVAYVSAITPSDQVTVEEYNWSPHKLAYDTRTIDSNIPGAYLYPPTA